MRPERFSRLLKITQQIMHKLGVGFGSLDTQASDLSTDHTALQNNGHVSRPHVDLDADLTSHLKPPHEKPTISSALWDSVSSPIRRGNGVDQMSLRSPSTPALSPQSFLHKRWGHPGQEIPPRHNPNPGLSHPRPQGWASSRTPGFDPASS